MPAIERPAERSAANYASMPSRVGLEHSDNQSRSFLSSLIERLPQPSSASWASESRSSEVTGFEVEDSQRGEDSEVSADNDHRPDDSELESNADLAASHIAAAPPVTTDSPNASDGPDGSASLDIWRGVEGDVVNEEATPVADVRTTPRQGDDGSLSPDEEAALSVPSGSSATRSRAIDVEGFSDASETARAAEVDPVASMRNVSFPGDKARDTEGVRLTAPDSLDSEPTQTAAMRQVSHGVDGANEEIRHDSSGRRGDGASRARSTARRDTVTASRSRPDTARDAAALEAAKEDLIAVDGARLTGGASIHRGAGIPSEGVQPMASLESAATNGGQELSPSPTPSTPSTMVSGETDSTLVGLRVPVGDTTVSGAAGQAARRGDLSGVSSTEVADRVRLVHRVAKAFQRLAADGGQIRMRMHPESLGSVRLEMRVVGRTMAASVIAESETASQLIREHLPELRQRLESQGMVIERFDVETRSEGEFGGNGADHQRWSQGSAGDRDGGSASGGGGRWRNRLDRVDPSAMVQSSKAASSAVLPIKLSPGTLDVHA